MGEYSIEQAEIPVQKFSLLNQFNNSRPNVQPLKQPLLTLYTTRKQRAIQLLHSWSDKNTHYGKIN
jgi:hypothetical protein